MVLKLAERDITKATVVVSVLFHGVTVHTERSSICSKADCPIPPGEFVLINTQILPGITPPVSVGMFPAVLYNVCEF